MNGNKIDLSDAVPVCQNCRDHDLKMKAKLKRKETRLAKLQGVPVAKYAPISKVSKERLQATVQFHQKK